MTLKLIISLASLALAFVALAFRRREQVDAGQANAFTLTGQGVSCIECSAIIKPGCEPFAGGLCSNCRKK